VPHEVFNMSDTEPVVAVVARSDASEWENIVPYDREAGKIIEGKGNSLVTPTGIARSPGGSSGGG
jgi:hypothetical protein